MNFPSVPLKARSSLVTFQHPAVRWRKFRPQCFLPCEKFVEQPDELLGGALIGERGESANVGKQDAENGGLSEGLSFPRNHARLNPGGNARGVSYNLIISEPDGPTLPNACRRAAVKGRGELRKLVKEIWMNMTFAGCEFAGWAKFDGWSRGFSTGCGTCRGL